MGLKGVESEGLLYIASMNVISSEYVKVSIRILAIKAIRIFFKVPLPFLRYRESNRETNRETGFRVF